MPAEEAKPVAEEMDAQFEGDAAAAPSAQGTGNAILGSPDHLRCEKCTKPPVSAETGCRLAVVKAKGALRRDLKFQREIRACRAAAGMWEQNAKVGGSFFDAQKGGLLFHRQLLSPAVRRSLIFLLYRPMRA